MSKLTLGSLFDGSGGFPLGGLLCGIEPLWASEIEPFPIRVTTKRIPQMKHYGDISKLNGADLPPVDIITFGSPCTDMSVAGKRAGLDGEQSVLFYEAIRIIKEMRCKTNDRHPRYAVWENVPGAFSSNKGADFQAVLEAVIGVKEPDAEVPLPEKGRWPYADRYMGNGWSVAYRTIDAQYFGVPQRRRRIYLVADFAGESAGEILFESEGVSRDFTPSGSPWKRTAGNVEIGTGTSGFDGYNFAVDKNLTSTLGVNCGMSTGRNGVICLNDQGGSVMSVTEDMTATLRAEEHGHQPCVMQSSGFCTEHSAKSRSVGYEEERSPTLRAGVVPGAVMSFEPGAASRVGGHTDENISGTLRANMGDNQTAVAIENHPTDGRCRIAQDGKVQTLTSRMGTGGIAVVEGIPFTQNQRDKVRILGDKSGALCIPATKQQTYVLQGSMIGREDKNGPQGSGVDEDVSFTLNTIDRHAVACAMTTSGFTQIEEEKSPTLLSRDYKDAPIVSQPSYGIDRAAFNQGQNALYKPAIEEEQQPTLTAKGPGAVAQPASLSSHPDYIVRRLTPTECARLQGFPDYWCSDLGIENPTEDDITFWTEVWETHRKINGVSKKPKSRKQIIKWLQNPHSDAAEYKMWGNGVALPCVCFVLSGIVLSTQDTAE